MTTPGRDPVPPYFRLDGFDCPSCQAFAHMTWNSLTAQYWPATGLAAAKCGRCSALSVWRQYELPDPDTGEPTVRGSMLHPKVLLGVPPHPDTPAPSRAIYEEARSIAQASPRAAAGLLRVAVDVLLREVVEASGNKKLDVVIGMAIAKGLPEHVGKALDVLRSNGNDALHPGMIDMDEEDPTNKVSALCMLMNLVVQHMITDPRLASEMFDKLPMTVRDAISRRDAPKA